jgi:hypothetical protein
MPLRFSLQNPLTPERGRENHCSCCFTAQRPQIPARRVKKYEDAAQGALLRKGSFVFNKMHVASNLLRNCIIFI